MGALALHACVTPTLPRSKSKQRSRAQSSLLRSLPDSQELLVKEPSEDRQEQLEAEGRCRTCGTPQNEIPRGCNQEGRVAGGLGAVTGFEWWPIKAYKPCGKAAKAGVLYTRKGQITDEMLFGSRNQKQ